MGKPSAPAAPDYAAAAVAQGDASKETAIANNAMNRLNQVGPNGNITYTLREGADPTNPQVGDYTQTTTLSDAQQGLLDGSNRIQQSLLNTGQAGLDRVTSTMSTPLDLTGTQPLVGGAAPATHTQQIGAAEYESGPDAAAYQDAPGHASLQNAPAHADLQGGPTTSSFQDAPGMASYQGGPATSSFQSGAAPATGYVNGVGASGYAGPTATSNFAATAGPGALTNLQAGQSASSLNPNQGAVDTTFGAVRGISGVNDASRQRVEQALMSRLQPQMDREERQLRTRLLNSGIEVGSDAYNNEFNRLSQAHNDLLMQSVIAGGAEESRQAQLDANLQQQSYNQAQGRGTFAQTGQTANNASNLAAANFGRDSMAQDFAQSQAVNNSANNNVKDAFSMNRAATQDSNANQQALFAQNQANAGLTNTAAEARLRAGLASAEMTNANANSNFAQRQAAVETNNANAANLFNQQNTNVDRANANATANYNQQLTGVNLANTNASNLFNQNLTNVNLANANANTQYNQDLTGVNTANANANTQYDQDLAGVNLANANATSNFNQNLATTQLNNTNATLAQTQNANQINTNNANADTTFNQTQASNAADNNLHQQQVAEALMTRQLPLNELNALRSGTQITAPTVSNYYTNGAAPAPVMDASIAQGNYDMSAYNNQVAGYNGLVGGLATLGGAAIKSDRRLKRNIRFKSIRNGHRWYSWDWRDGSGSSEGVIAQQVQKTHPEAVVLQDGFLAVNYTALGL